MRAPILLGTRVLLGAFPAIFWTWIVQLVWTDVNQAVTFGILMPLSLCILAISTSPPPLIH